MVIKCFGIVKDITGQSTISMDSESLELTTVEQLKNHLKHKFPEIKNLSSLMIAVNQVYAEDDLPLNDHDEIALIPPVAGG